MVSLLLVGFTILQMKEAKNMCDKVTASAHLLSRTAIRVGVGPSAKKALMDYAKGKPEFAKLMKERVEQKDK
uniref:Secreted protein n=1 Tax=Heterorhabditis bacteriophora TaxID=37862 RepID=A0A1I7W9N5_HETBA